MLIKRELGKKQVSISNIAQVKEKIGKFTKNLAEHAINCNEMIEKHSRNVLRDGMTILVHSYSKCVMRVIQSAQERGIKISVLATES